MKPFVERLDRLPLGDATQCLAGDGLHRRHRVLHAVRQLFVQEAAALFGGIALTGLLAGPAAAVEGQLRIAKQFGIVYLLLDVAQDQKLIEQQGKAAGVDIEIRRDMWTNLREINRAGTTIILTTHYLEEAESLCDEIAIINHGEVVACEKTPDLVARLDRKSLLVTPDTPLDAVPAGLDGYETQILPGGLLEIAYRPSSQNVAEILDRVNQAGIAIRDLSIEEGHLEDVFLELTRSKVA